MQMQVKNEWSSMRTIGYKQNLMVEYSFFSLLTQKTLSLLEYLAWIEKLVIHQLRMPRIFLYGSLQIATKSIQVKASTAIKPRKRA